MTVPATASPSTAAASGGDGPTLAAVPHHHHLQTDDDDDRIAVHLRRLPFSLVWWLALLCHSGCAAFLCSTTAIYVFLGGIDMIYYNKLLGSSLRNEMATLGYVFVAIAALHFLEIVRMLWYSVRARKLTFNAINAVAPAIVPTVPVSAGGKVQPSHTRTQKRQLHLPPLLHKLVPRSLLLSVCQHLQHLQPSPRVALILRRIARFLKRCKTKLLDRKQGLLGLESPYFNVLFLFRETTEIASQSYQMYQCSMFISSAWINNLFLAITVFNCWSTPLLQHALARHNALERSVCLSLDGLLDAGTCILIPLVIVLKYVYAFDAALLEFPIENLTDPQWFTALILENRMLFAMDKTDLFTSLIPHYSLFGCMRKAKKLIHRLPTELEHEELEVTYVNAMRVLVPKKNKKTRNAEGHHTAAGDNHSGHRGLKQKTGEMPGWKRRLVHVFFVGWGVTVLVVHLRARSVAKRYTDVVACKQQLRPWFATSFMCASYQFDCVEQGNVATVTSDDLTSMDAATLSSLRFSGLLKILIYNSTIVAWPASASLNAASHASLISIGVVAANMTAFPEGLQDAQPDSLQDVRFAQTNLTALPRDLSRGWRVSKISFEYCAFTEYPAVFLDLRVDELSLAGSRFTMLSEALGNMSTSYEDLVLGDNAFLTALPSSGLPRGTTVLSIENTGIAELPTAITSPSTTTTSTSTGPDGMDMFGGTRPLAIYAHNTPLCDTLGGVSDGDTGTSNSSSSVTLYCATRDPNGVARFPLAWTIERFKPT